MTVTDAELRGLAELLIDCVDGGASVSFMHPLAMTKAVEFWRRVADAVVRGERALLVAEDASGVVGTVQLLLDQPEKQPHRADLSKMLVHRRARRRGMGAGRAPLRMVRSRAPHCVARAARSLATAGSHPPGAIESLALASGRVRLLCLSDWRRRCRFFLCLRPRS